MTNGQSLAMKIIPIVRMDCPTCILTLENQVKKLEGVNEVRGNYIAKTLKVVYDPKVVQLAEIETAIEHAGYRIAYKKYPSVISKLKGLLQRNKPSMVQPLSDADFPGTVLHASKPVFVLFSSENCPACRVFRPIFMEAAADLKEKAEFYEMDISSSTTWRRYDIVSVPTILIFRDGQVRKKLDMLPKKDDIAKALIE